MDLLDSEDSDSNFLEETVSQREQSQNQIKLSLPGTKLPSPDHLFILPRRSSPFYERAGYRPCAIGHPYSNLMHDLLPIRGKPTWNIHMDNLLFLPHEARRWSSSARRKVYIARLEAYADAMVNVLREKRVAVLSDEDSRWSERATLKIAHAVTGGMEYDLTRMHLRLKRLQDHILHLSTAVQNSSRENGLELVRVSREYAIESFNGVQVLTEKTVDYSIIS